EKREFSYRFVHRLKDGTSVETDPVSTSIPLVTVNDPFDEPLIIELFPNYDPTPIKLLIVDVTYEDPSSSRARVQQVRFAPTDIDSRRVRFARADPSAGDFSIQITILGTDKSVRRLRSVRLEDTVVFLGEHLALETFQRRTA